MTPPASAGTQRRRSRATNFTGEPTSAASTRVRRPEPGSSEDLVAAFVLRSGRALARIAERMPRDRLLAAVGASTDTDVLFSSLHEAAAIGAEILPDRPDPLTEALLRGSEMKREMLKAEGGVLSAQQLAEHLGITPQGLGRKRERSQVFWLDVGDGYVYPAFQIGKNGLLRGIRDVLDAFTVEDAWMRVNFMLTGDARLEGQRPIDLLRKGQTDEVVRAAAAYGEHGAA
ncbi:MULTISPECIES: Rv2175c family DNA-binding protein [Alphaproteobacteria]|jgi:hypothetical protein|nr:MULTISPECIES: Rv2175c family DNA-binding protein [Alphaproteobacteria]DAG73323.1 MAG TPA: hypothetical protein [Bacteriophage sp.]